MKIKPVSNKPILEGYLTGGAALIIVLLWLWVDAFNPMIIFVLYLVAISYLSLSTLWLFSGGETIRAWLSDSPVRYLTAGLIGVLVVAGPLILILLKSVR